MSSVQFDEELQLTLVSRRRRPKMQYEVRTASTEIALNFISFILENLILQCNIATKPRVAECSSISYIEANPNLMVQLKERLETP